MASIFKRGGKNNRGGSYYIQWRDHNGRRRTKSAKTTGKATAERIAKKYEADAALRRDGVIDPMLDAISKESQRTIESHVADYEGKMRAASRSDHHIRQTVRYIRETADHGGFISVSDIRADAVNRFANSLSDAGKSARTVQAYLTAVKGFTKWLSAGHKLHRDPLLCVKKPNPKTDRRRERRILLPEEWKWLEPATILAPTRYRMTGPARLLLYRLAIQTGLRSGELRSLTRGRIVGDSSPPFVTCKAGSTKNGELARQFIQPNLASDLLAHVSKKSPHAPIFNMPHETDVADMFRDDLGDARKAWLSEAKKDPDEYSRREQSDFLMAASHDGETADFHSLRHTCGAWLALAGEHPKVIQSIMRHASITLTMDTYGHLFPSQEADAVAKLDDLLSGSITYQQQATGTADAFPIAVNSAQLQAQQSGRDSLRTGARPSEDSDESLNNKSAPNPLRIAEIGDTLLNPATPCDAAAPLAQLAEQLTLNQ